jgi:hypothetical protein
VSVSPSFCHEEKNQVLNATTIYTLMITITYMHHYDVVSTVFWSQNTRSVMENGVSLGDHFFGDSTACCRLVASRFVEQRCFLCFSR